MSFGLLYYLILWESPLGCCPPLRRNTSLRKLFTSLFFVTQAHHCSAYSLGYANITAFRPHSRTDQRCDLAKKEPSSPLCQKSGPGILSSPGAWNASSCTPTEICTSTVLRWFGDMKCLSPPCTQENMLSAIRMCNAPSATLHLLLGPRQERSCCWQRMLKYLSYCQKTEWGGGEASSQWPSWKVK